MEPDTPSVIVAGDIVLDRHIYEGERLLLQDKSQRGTHLVEEAGGAAITQRLIAAVFAGDSSRGREARRDASKKDQKNKQSASAAPPEPAVCRLACKLPNEGSPWPERLTGYACWSPQTSPHSQNQYWRVSKALGYGPPDGAASSTAKTATPKVPGGLGAADDLPRNSRIVVLDDAGDDFRRKENQKLWHLPVGKGTRAGTLPTWIILKLTGSIGYGDLWDQLMRCQPQQRLVVIVSARLLRQKNVRLSRGLSWERTVEHLVDELGQNAELRALCKARHLIVNFEHDGVLWIDFGKPRTPVARLVFDAENAEGEWGNRIKGEVFGYLTCLTAAIVHVLVSQDARDVDLQPAIEGGLSAMRNLHEKGHGIAKSEKGEVELGHGFPAARLATEILQPTHRFVRATVPWNQRAGNTNAPVWSILASLQNPLSPTRPLYGFARQLLVQGESVLAHVPHLRVGKLVTAGRDEMEELRSLRRILKGYNEKSSGKRPLSIGVFGAPGAGKSFGVEQLALGIFGEPGAKTYAGWMEFNLSQFDQPRDLIGAFHQVRDRALQGLTPVVFWDEFDSQKYRWLQYLLAPMQDGRFQEGQITHTLGKCVFIFAGGTSWSFEEFGPSENASAETKQAFTLAKGPDFKSRLDGHLNVLGPNQRARQTTSGKAPLVDKADIFFPVRRALMIRGICGCKKNERLEIDPGLLNALLEIPRYEHGARSLSKMLEPFNTLPKESRSPLRRSQLPAPNQLGVHVDAGKFYELCGRDQPFRTQEIIEKLAPAIHEAWRAIARREKRRSDVPYTELNAEAQRSNIAAALRIPEILALVGLQVKRGTATAREEETIREHLERHLETLAEEEHNRWMAHALADGWKFAATRNDEQHLHHCLLPFHALREVDKEKDRNSVRNFPDFVRRAGFKIVFS